MTREAKLSSPYKITDHMLTLKTVKSVKQTVKARIISVERHNSSLN